MVTPFDESGALDVDAAADLARWLVADGNDGLVLAGTGEPSPGGSRDDEAVVPVRDQQPTCQGGRRVEVEGTRRVEGRHHRGGDVARIGPSAGLLGRGHRGHPTNRLRAHPPAKSPQKADIRGLGRGRT